MPAAVITAYNPGDVQGSFNDPAEPWEIRSVYLTPQTLAPFLGEDDRSLPLPRFRQPFISDPALVRQFMRVHRLLEHSQASDLAASAGLLEFVTGLLASAPDDRPSALRGDRAAVRRAQAHLEAHALEAVPLSDLMVASGLSRAYLVRAFRATTGLPPHLYQLGVRVRVAKARLRESVPLAQLALDLGFADQSHFGRVFKSITGLSPTQYRRALRF